MEMGVYLYTLTSAKPLTFTSIRALIMASPLSIATFLIISCPVFVRSLLVSSQTILKDSSISPTWNCVFCLDIRNVHSRKPVSSLVCSRDLVVDCGDCVLIPFSSTTALCKNLHCCPLKQHFNVPKYGHDSR